MSIRFTRDQMLTPIREDADFARWYVDEFMKTCLTQYWLSVSDDGKHEMVLNGRAQARAYGIGDIESQTHFITFMWTIGPNFHLQPGFAEIAANRQLTGPDKINRFYDLPADQATTAIHAADDRYWYPEMIATLKTRGEMT